MIKTNQKGFTLIEVLIAVAITGLIVGAASGAGAHVIQSKRTTAQMVALRQVQTAGYWVSRDALCAQSVTTGGGSGFPLTLLTQLRRDKYRFRVKKIENNHILAKKRLLTG